MVGQPGSNSTSAMSFDDDFARRIGRIEKSHKRQSRRGMGRRFGGKLLLMLAKQLGVICVILAILLGAKLAVISAMDKQDHQRLVARLVQGDWVERGLAWGLQEDPVTQWLYLRADQICRNCLSGQS